MNGQKGKLFRGDSGVRFRIGVRGREKREGLREKITVSKQVNVLI